jgi:hypothetical protein
MLTPYPRSPNFLVFRSDAHNALCISPPRAAPATCLGKCMLEMQAQAMILTLTCSRDEGCKGSERIKHLVPRDEGPTEEALVVVWWH